MKTGRIYKIISIQGNECYVGSTFNTTRDRFRKHKQHYQEWKTGKTNRVASSVDLFEKYGVENCKMILIKEYEFCDREHLKAYEQLWINKLRPINRTNPFGGRIKFLLKEYKKQWYEKNKDHVAQWGKQYRKDNKEKIYQTKKKYREENRESLLFKKKDYYDSNKEFILLNGKRYYEENKPQISQKRKEKSKCEVCDCEIRRCDMPRHLRTKKHQNNLNTSS